MIEYRKEKIEQEVPSKVICDKCGREATPLGGHRGEDGYEFQEFLFIRFRGGYGSVFGDGNDVECDICQHCLKELLGDYMRVSDSLYGENLDDALEDKDNQD
jgi:hypothetical protein